MLNGAIIRYFHVALIMFMIMIPFSKNINLIRLHLILIPFLIAHWLTNNDTCALTELEKYLSNKTCNYDTMIGSIVGPVFKLENADQISRYLVYTGSILLWSVSLYEYRNSLKRK